jgi:glucose-1-phosphate thymidylyltransferase
VKGVVLAGGFGRWLWPLTKIANKHLLPVYDQPMIYYPIQCLANAGIRDVLLVTGGNDAGDFLRLLGNGKEFGLKELHYAYQEGEGGIADALRLAEDFADGDKIVVVLGDNLIERDIRQGVANFLAQPRGARIYLKQVADPERFAVAVRQNGRIVRIEERPEKPAGHYAVIGIYMYDPSVFHIIKTLKPSGRGELEITDVNNAFIKKGVMTYEVIEGWWGDAGSSIQDLWRVNDFLGNRKQKKQ